MLKNWAACYATYLPLLLSCWGLVTLGPAGHPNRDVDTPFLVRVVALLLLDRFEPCSKVQDEPIVRARLYIMTAIVEM